jgi:hypothetical protein
MLEESTGDDAVGTAPGTILAAAEFNAGDGRVVLF